MEGIPGKKSFSRELRELFDADQADRKALQGKWNDPELSKTMIDNDSKRLIRAREIYEEHMSRTALLSSEELIQLAFLFQHSPESDDYRKAYDLGEAAGDEGKWIAAAAEDRWLLSKGEKQKWGTRFLNETEQAPMASDEESGITDEMRAQREIPPRAEQLSMHIRLSESEE